MRMMRSDRLSRLFDSVCLTGRVVCDLSRDPQFFSHHERELESVQNQ